MMTFPLEGMYKSCDTLIMETYRGLQLSSLAKLSGSWGACLSIWFQNLKINQIDPSWMLNWFVRKMRLISWTKLCVFMTTLMSRMSVIWLDVKKWTMKTNHSYHKTLIHRQITRIIPVPSVIWRLRRKKMLQDILRDVMMPIKIWETLASLSPSVPSARSASLQSTT